MALHLRGIFLPDETERDVWIVNDHLTFTRPAASVEVESIGSTGWVIPGFVDAHCHVGIAPQGPLADPEEQAAQAITNRDAGALLLRDAGCPVDNSAVQHRNDLPRLVRAGQHIARTRRYLRGFGDEVEPESLVSAVERQVASGDGWVKIAADWIDRATGDLSPTFPDAELAAGISRAHELGARVAAHVFSEAALPGLIAAKVDSIEHGTGLTEDLIDAVADSGAVLVPTLINTDNFPSIAEQGQEKFPAYAKHMRALFATSRQRVRSAFEAGIPIHAGTDAGSTVPHGQIREEIRALVDAGIPQPDVIAAASWAAREWLGFDGLTEGAPADLLVFQEDPRSSIATLYSPLRTMLRGRVIA